MRPWIANMLGLAIGFALGGAALLHFRPQLEALRQARSWQVATAASPRVVPAERADPVALRPTPAPAPLPRIAAPILPHWRRPAATPSPRLPQPRLPQVLYPEQPDPEQPGEPPSGGRRLAGVAGTGFFIAGDGTLLTAAHVVEDCRRTQIVSRLVKLAPARVLARDKADDVALLQADHVRPPAVLPIGRPAGARGRVFVLGFPASAGRLVPAETWGTLENAHLPAGVGIFRDPRFLVWIEASAVTHGYSGGPMLDPRNGDVVGLVKGTVDGNHLRGVPGMPTTGVAIGPGSGRLAAFVERELPWVDLSLVSAEGDNAVALARRATVHVFCWR